MITGRRSLLFFVVVLFCFVSFFAVRRPLTVVASLIVEHRLSGHGSRAQPLRGMWDLPGSGHEPVSPASAGGLSTTAPPGKPRTFNEVIYWKTYLLSQMLVKKLVVGMDFPELGL